MTPYTYNSSLQGRGVDVGVKWEGRKEKKWMEIK